MRESFTVLMKQGPSGGSGNEEETLEKYRGDQVGFRFLFTVIYTVVSMKTQGLQGPPMCIDPGHLALQYSAHCTFSRRSNSTQLV